MNPSVVRGWHHQGSFQIRAYVLSHSLFINVNVDESWYIVSEEAESKGNNVICAPVEICGEPSYGILLGRLCSLANLLEVTCGSFSTSFHGFGGLFI